MDVALKTESEDDWPWLWHWRHEVSNPDWKQWDSPFLHEHMERLTFDQFRHQQTLNPRTRAIIVVNGQRVGTVHRNELPPYGGGWWDFGIAIYDPEHRKQGAGYTASTLWIDHTFKHTDAHVITLSTWSGNEQMINLGTKLGFTECSRIPQARLWRGSRYDVVQMSLLRSDWFPLSARR
ncbi:MAG: GNAT family protein [Flaviflexus sp.]|uniref:GNAT family N-acetyltransferase n=1 Tax=Flaviflexus sp. TaxID=1969482 RepID=UPI00352EC59C